MRRKRWKSVKDYNEHNREGYMRALGGIIGPMTAAATTARQKGTTIDEIWINNYLCECYNNAETELDAIQYSIQVRRCTYG